MLWRIKLYFSRDINVICKLIEDNLIGWYLCCQVLCDSVLIEFFFSFFFMFSLISLISMLCHPKIRVIILFILSFNYGPLFFIRSLFFWIFFLISSIFNWFYLVFISNVILILFIVVFYHFLFIFFFRFHLSTFYFISFFF